MYVNNLPINLDKYGLKGIFSKAGRVVDSYIPVGRTRGNSPRFGFVKFGSRYAAARSIQMLNNKTIRGKKISVCMARSNKQRRKYTSTVGAAQGRQRTHQNAGKWRRKSEPMDRSKEADTHSGQQEG